MKVVYINFGGYWLTTGKVYDVQEGQLRGGSIHDYYVINDKGIEHSVERSLFVLLSDVRDKRLKILGI